MLSRDTNIIYVEDRFEYHEQSIEVISSLSSLKKRIMKIILDARRQGSQIFDRRKNTEVNGKTREDDAARWTNQIKAPTELYFQADYGNEFQQKFRQGMRESLLMKICSSHRILYCIVFLSDFFFVIALLAIGIGQILDLLENGSQYRRSCV